jgi:CelD/BcsL family acetyltransferase involved in cellulose biosynthesis
MAGKSEAVAGQPAVSALHVTDPLSFFAEPHPLVAEWAALAIRIDAAPMLHPGWSAAWWKAFGRGGLTVFSARHPHSGALAGVLVLRRRWPGLVSPTNWHSGSYGPLVDDDRVCAPLLDAPCLAAPRVLDLDLVDPHVAGQVAARARAAGFRTLSRTVQRSPFIALDGDWPAYERTIDAKVRRELMRRRRRLEAQDRLELVVEDGGDRLEALLAEGLRVETSGWKERRRTAINSREDTRRFYASLAAWAAGNGWLRLAFLRLGGRPLAFDFCLEHADVHYLLKTGYDPAFRASAPGKLLRQEMIARAFRNGLTCYEFLGADEPWKLEWTRTTRDRDRVQAFRRSPVGLLGWSAYAYGRPLAKEILRRTGRRGVG